MTKSFIILLYLFLTSCSPVLIDKLPFEWERKERVEIIKTTRPGILTTGEIINWYIWVTPQTTKLQIVYYAKPPQETGVYSVNTPWKMVGISREIDITDPRNFLMDGQYKKAMARFGPLSYPGQFSITVRAWNKKGMWNDRFKDTTTDIVIVERGLTLYE